MTKDSFDPKLPKGFHYLVKNGEMIIQFLCDCCGNEIKLSKKLKEKSDDIEKSFEDVFFDLKSKLDNRFHRCSDCGLLICEDCWDNRETKCKDCPFCTAE